MTYRYVILDEEYRFSDLNQRGADPVKRICGMCENPVDGYAQINDVWYCHPDDESKPDCYSEAQWGTDAFEKRLDAIISDLERDTP